MVVISGDIGREKLQSNLTHQHANTKLCTSGKRNDYILSLVNGVDPDFGRRPNNNNNTTPTCKAP